MWEGIPMVCRVRAVAMASDGIDFLGATLGP